MSTLPGLTVRRVGPEAAAVVLGVVRAAFGTRPPLDPPADALGETEQHLATALAHGGLVASLDGRDVGALVLDPDRATLWLRRVGVLPEVRDHGVATDLVSAALATSAAYDEVAVLAREELPATVAFWRDHGFVETRRRSPYVELRRPAVQVHDAPDAETMRALGVELAAGLRAGDVVVLTGELGAGKTTFTQGLGAGLRVRGEVTSPTFVIARVHRGGRLPLVHADAYRLGDVRDPRGEVDALDLDATLDDSVTLVEWGEGLVEQLAAEHLEIRLERRDDDTRVATLVGNWPDQLTTR